MLSEEGEVWMSGSLTEDLAYFTFTKLSLSEVIGRVSRIVAGGHNIAFITAANRVYVMGDNTHLKFDVDTKTIMEPYLIPTPNLIVQDVSIAEDHFILLCARQAAVGLVTCCFGAHRSGACCVGQLGSFIVCPRSLESGANDFRRGWWSFARFFVIQ